MKKFIAVCMTSAMVMSACAAVVSAENEVNVVLNGTALALEQPAFIENDRTLIPMRAIFEAVGADVVWDEEMSTVHSSRKIGEEVHYLTMQVGTPTAYVDGQPVELDVPAKIIEDRTFVPLRFVVESLGETVEWDQESMTVSITTK